MAKGPGIYNIKHHISLEESKLTWTLNPKFSPSVSHFSSAFRPYLNLATALWIIDFLVHCLNQEIARKKNIISCWPKNECFVRLAEQNVSLTQNEAFYFQSYFYLIFSSYGHSIQLWNDVLKKKIKPFVLNIPKGKLWIAIIWLFYFLQLIGFVCLSEGEGGEGRLPEWVILFGRKLLTI